jgi:hypothetical protein
MRCKAFVLAALLACAQAQAQEFHFYLGDDEGVDVFKVRGTVTVDPDYAPLSFVEVLLGADGWRLWPVLFPEQGPPIIQSFYAFESIRQTEGWVNLELTIGENVWEFRRIGILGAPEESFFATGRVYFLGAQARTDAFISPAPEPEVYALFLGGLLLVAVRRITLGRCARSRS